MSISKTKIINFLKITCRKYDKDKTKGTTLRLLKKGFNVDSFVKLALYEINGMTLDSSPYPKHKRVAGLWTFAKEGAAYPESFPLGSLIAQMADFISTEQIEVKRLLEAKKKNPQSNKK